MILKTARKLVVLVVGGTALLIGVVMLVTPGPGVVGILAGLAILATEFVWARTLLRRMKQRAAALLPVKSEPGAKCAAARAAQGSPSSPPCRP
jgi:tellurite resistance protein TerC